nr:MAG TPA: hypothetical protein [Caudoviricetes sp.]
MTRRPPCRTSPCTSGAERPRRFFSRYTQIRMGPKSED